MDAHDIPKLSTLAERLGWPIGMFHGTHVVDLLLNRAATDLIAALADTRGPNDA